MTVTKSQLTETYRGGPKGKAHRGTLVRLIRQVPIGKPVEEGGIGIIGWHEAGGIYEVCDLMQRRNYTKPEHIGVKYTDLEVAFGVSLADIEVV